MKESLDRKKAKKSADETQGMGPSLKEMLAKDRELRKDAKGNNS